MHFPSHRAHWEAFRTNGTLLLIGTFANPQEGALAIFTSREVARVHAADLGVYADVLTPGSIRIGDRISPL